MSESHETQLVHLWHESEKISLTFLEPLEGDICKMVSANTKVFFMTTTNQVYVGKLDNVENAPFSLTLTKFTLCATDIAVNSQYLFLVTTQGNVQKVDLESLNVISTIDLDETTKCCEHEYVWFDNFYQKN